MTIQKNLLAGFVALIISISVQASNINVGGVVWDPDAVTPVNDWFGSSDFYITTPLDFSNPAIQVTTGIGRINQVNGNDYFCDAASCNLTYSYSYTYDPSLTVIYGPYTQLNFIAGSVDFYVINDGDFIPYNTASVTSGNLWLSTVGFDLSTTPGGPATTTVLESLGTANGSFLFEAWLNVVDNGGLATGNFIDLKTKEVGDSGMFANMKMAGSVDVINASGSVNLHADSIPEPSSIALIALGLLGFIGIRRSKNK